MRVAGASRLAAAVLAVAWCGVVWPQQPSPAHPPTPAASASAQDAASSRAAEVDALEPAVDVGEANRTERGKGSGHDSAASAASARSSAPGGAPVAVDHLDLGTTSITGNQELPKVLYIVPWKRSDLGELVGRPVNTLLDEVLAPVDPDVFKRHLEYYDELFDAAPAGAGKTKE